MAINQALTAATKTTATWSERWGKSRREVEEADSFDIQAKLDRDYGAALLGATVGVVDLAIDIASTAGKLSIAASKFEQAYAPENPLDLYSSENEALRVELEDDMQRTGAALRYAIKNPITMIKTQVSSQWEDLHRKAQQGDYFEAGRVGAHLGIDVGMLASGIGGLAKTSFTLSTKAARFGFRTASKLGLEALDLAASSTTNTAKIMASSESLLTVQYKLHKEQQLLRYKKARK